MIAETKIKDRIEYADDMARAGYIPDEGPALLQGSGVYSGAYNAKIDQRLVALKENRTFTNAIDARERLGRLKRKAAVGLGVVAASAVLIVSNGGPGRMFDGVKSFPQHVATLFEGPPK